MSGEEIKPLTGERKMKKFSFPVDIVVHDDGVDIDEVVTAVSQCLSVEGIEAAVKEPTIKSLTEQGYKIWRSRVLGVSVEDLAETA